MEISVLILESALNDQKEQLRNLENRNKDRNAQGYSFRTKAIMNCRSAIEDLEKGILKLKQ